MSARATLCRVAGILLLIGLWTASGAAVAETTGAELRETIETLAD